MALWLARRGGERDQGCVRKRSHRGGRRRTRDHAAATAIKASHRRSAASRSCDSNGDKCAVGSPRRGIAHGRGDAAGGRGRRGRKHRGTGYATAPKKRINSGHTWGVEGRWVDCRTISAVRLYGVHEGKRPPARQKGKLDDDVSWNSWVAFLMKRAGEKQAWIWERVEERCKQVYSCIWLAQVRSVLSLASEGRVKRVGRL